MPPSPPNTIRLRRTSMLPYDLPDFVGGMLSVSTLAALSSLTTVDDRALDDGALVWVASRKRYYMLDKLATDAVLNGEIVATASGTGRFFSLNWTTSQHWSLQAQWEISAATGSDDATGLPGSPLATFQEYIRRCSRIFVPQVVTILDTLPDSDNLVFEPQVIWKQSVSATFPTLTISGLRTLGQPTVVVTSSDEVGNAAPLLDLGVALTVGDIVQATDGASTGATAVIVALVLGTNYRTSPWRNAANGFRIAPPIAGANVAVTSRPTVNAVSIATPTTQFGVTLNDLDVKDFSANTRAVYVANVCEFAGTNSIMSSTGQLRIFSGCSITTSGTVGSTAGGIGLFRRCGIVRTGIILWASFSRAEYSDCVIQGARLDFGNVGGQASIGFISSLGIFGQAAATTALTVQRGATVEVQGTLYGPDPGGASIGTTVLEDGHVYVKSTVTPTLTGATELQLEGLATGNVFTPATGVIAAAAALVTWAQWVATFNRNVVAYGTGSSISNHV